MVEKAKYAILEKLGNGIEIRRYPPQLVAKTSMAPGMNGSFGVIARYIFGGNKQGEGIAMTAPVVTNNLEMYFFMPRKYDMKSLPKPENGEVKISRLPVRTVAVRRFSGFWTGGSIKRNETQLMAEVAKNGFVPIGEPFLMRYDPPWQLPFFRRNEVAVQVGKRSPHQPRKPAHVKLAYHAFNLAFILLYRILPNGAGTCLIADKKAFTLTGGFDPSFKFEDAEFIRRAARSHSFGMLHTVAHVSDRRFRKYGFARTLATYLFLSFLFAIGAFKLANGLDYEFGKY